MCNMTVGRCKESSYHWSWCRVLTHICLFFSCRKKCDCDTNLPLTLERNHMMSRVTLNSSHHQRTGGIFRRTDQLPVWGPPSASYYSCLMAWTRYNISCLWSCFLNLRSVVIGHCRLQLRILPTCLSLSSVFVSIISHSNDWQSWNQPCSSAWTLYLI